MHRKKSCIWICSFRIIFVEPYWKGSFPAKKGVAFIIYHYSKEKKPLEKFSIIFIGNDLFSWY